MVFEGLMMRSIFYSRVSATFLVALLFLSVFSVGVYAQEAVGTTIEIESVVVAQVDTVLLVNPGDPVDFALAFNVARDHGYSILYTNPDGATMPEEMLGVLASGIYSDVRNVYAIGGTQVISSELLDSVGSYGESYAGFDTARIAGTTGTGTAVEVINQFYGPGLIGEVTFVSYPGDGLYDESAELMTLAAQTEGFVIPLPADSDGIPVAVLDTMNTIGIDTANYVGNFDDASEFADDAALVGVSTGGIVEGDYSDISQQLTEQIVAETSASDDVDIVLVEAGTIVPIPSSDDVIVYYRDEDNDNVDDLSGSALDGIGRGLYDSFVEIGVGVDHIICSGDDADLLVDFEQDLSGEIGDFVDVGFVDMDEGDASVDAMLDEHREDVVDIVRDFEDAEKEFEDLYALHEVDFSAYVPSMMDEFINYYETQRAAGAFSDDQLLLGAQIIDESNKQDYVAVWQLMNEFGSQEHSKYYAVQCAGDGPCIDDQYTRELMPIGDMDEYLGLDDREIVLFEDVHDLMGVIGFVKPGGEELFRQEIVAVDGSSSIDGLVEAYNDAETEQALQAYLDGRREEMVAQGDISGADALTVEDVRDDMAPEGRLGLEAEALLTGIVTPETISDSAVRAEVYSGFESLADSFRSQGVYDVYSFNGDDWGSLWNTYYDVDSGSVHEVPSDIVEQYGARVTYYNTWEYDNPGIAYDLRGASYNPGSGSFSFIDNDGILVQGKYDSSMGTCSYIDSDGNFISGNLDGLVQKYSHDAPPEGYTYDSEVGTYKDAEGNFLTPPAEFNRNTGAYEFEHPDFEGEYVYCGGGECMVSGIPEGYVRNEDGSFSRDDYDSYIVNGGQVYAEWAEGTYYDPRAGGYVDAQQGNDAFSGYEEYGTNPYAGYASDDGHFYPGGYQGYTSYGDPSNYYSDPSGVTESAEYRSYYTQGDSFSNVYSYNPSSDPFSAHYGNFYHAPPPSDTSETSGESSYSGYYGSYESGGYQASTDGGYGYGSHSVSSSFSSSTDSATGITTYSWTSPDGSVGSTTMTHGADGSWTGTTSYTDSSGATVTSGWSGGGSYSGSGGHSGGGEGGGGSAPSGGGGGGGYVVADIEPSGGRFACWIKKIFGGSC